MSWSLSLDKLPQVSAGESITKAHEKTWAYRSDGPAPKRILDDITSFCRSLIHELPNDTMIAVSSSGHIGSDFRGNLSINLTIGSIPEEKHTPTPDQPAPTPTHSDVLDFIEGPSVIGPPSEPPSAPEPPSFGGGGDFMGGGADGTF